MTSARRHRQDQSDAPDRAVQVEEWFTGPVIAAAVASVPAMFLTTMQGAAGRVGVAVNVATMVVSSPRRLSC